jgi:hypothetical protein
VLRKLIPKLQAFSQGIQEASMVRFYSSIYADDKMLIRQMSGDSVSHGFPTTPPQTLTECQCSAGVPDVIKRSLILVRNSLFLAQRHGI